MIIGILTFHRAYNYGAILQAFALQKAIHQLGCDSEIIDYLSREKQEQIKLFHWNRSIGAIKNLDKLFKDLYRAKKNKAFDRFISENIVLSSDHYSSFEEMKELDNSNKYDNYIVGSDQVWNIKNNKRDLTYVLAFCQNNHKRNSYAASIGNAEFDDEMTAIYSKELSHFRVLSVREESAISQFGFLNCNNARVCIDPTLLLSKEDYLNIASKRFINSKYAFLYTIEEDRNLRNYARHFCKEKGISLIDSKRSYSFFTHSSPCDFLSLFANAEYVFTNSFHGTAFSIIMQKQFATEVNTKHRKNTRSFDLLSKTMLTMRDIDSDLFCMESEINYEKTNIIVSQLRRQSLKILSEILELNKTE